MFDYLPSSADNASGADTVFDYVNKSVTDVAKVTVAKASHVLYMRVVWFFERNIMYSREYQIVRIQRIIFSCAY